MKQGELVKKLKKIGCHIKRDGANHQIWVSPVTGETFTIPRHPSQELPTGTAENIMKAAGLK